eukprot:2589511-Pyramimonas_sp.AAC.1
MSIPSSTQPRRLKLRSQSAHCTSESSHPPSSAATARLRPGHGCASRAKRLRRGGGDGVVQNSHSAGRCLGSSVRRGSKICLASGRGLGRRGDSHGDQGNGGD